MDHLLTTSATEHVPQISAERGGDGIIQVNQGFRSPYHPLASSWSMPSVTTSLPPAHLRDLVAGPVSWSRHTRIGFCRCFVSPPSGRSINRAPLGTGHHEVVLVIVSSDGRDLPCTYRCCSRHRCRVCDVCTQHKVRHWNASSASYPSSYARLLWTMLSGVTVHAPAHRLDREGRDGEVASSRNQTHRSSSGMRDRHDVLVCPLAVANASTPCPPSHRTQDARRDFAIDVEIDGDVPPALSMLHNLPSHVGG